MNVYGVMQWIGLGVVEINGGHIWAIIRVLVLNSLLFLGEIYLLVRDMY